MNLHCWLKKKQDGARPAQGAAFPYPMFTKPSWAPLGAAVEVWRRSRAASFGGASFEGASFEGAVVPQDLGLASLVFGFPVAGAGREGTLAS